MGIIKLSVFTFLLFIISPAQAMAFCNELKTPYIDEVKALNENAEKIISAALPTLMTIKVSHDGKGSVKVMTDQTGNLLGIRMEYTNADGEFMQQTKTIEEFNKGGSVNFTKEGQKANPLSLKSKKGTVVSKTIGGLFTFSLLTDKDPVTYVDHQLAIVKVGLAWKVKRGDKVLTGTTLSPTVALGWGGLSWAGTFSGATFQ